MVRFARWVAASHWIAGALAVGMVIGARRLAEWRSGEVLLVAGLLALWLAVGYLFSLARRPGVFDSLVLLDRRGGWKDRFSSAWAFLQEEERREPEELHLRRAETELPKAVSQFPGRLPLPSLRWTWIVPAAAVLLALLPLGRIAPDAGDLSLTDEMKRAASGQAEELARESAKVKNLESLTEEEREELERLRVDVDGMADQLAESEELTAGEMLEALEARARAAERLAEKMGLGSDAWASAEMIAEMKRHPDTADLALAIQDKAAEPAAMEAMELHGTLDDVNLPRETSERVTGVLEQIVSEATSEDEGRAVGERVGNASRKMRDGQAKTAAREFEELAKHFRFLGSREEAREKLEELANSLRDAGSEISGSELEQMEKIASEGRGERDGSGGLRSLDNGDVPEDLQKMLAPQLAQSGAQGNQPAPPMGEPDPDAPKTAPVPGMQPGEAPGEGKGGAKSQALQAPVPGEMPPQGGQGGMQMGMSDKAQDGKGEGGMLGAPVPGQAPGDSPAGTGVMAGAAGSQASSGQGGDQAGTGTAEMFEDRSEAMEAQKDSEVVAQVNEDGESTVRAVEGQARAEKATRSRQEIVAEFLSAEEQALDGKSLPLSRREHVIRYFSAIRRQFEESESAAN